MVFIETPTFCTGFRKVFADGGTIDQKSSPPGEGSALPPGTNLRTCPASPAIPAIPADPVARRKTDRMDAVEHRREGSRNILMLKKGAS
jgi:hypothetical protein